VSDLVVTPSSGGTIKWYDAASGGNVVLGSATLENRTYYASQTVNGVESTTRLEVTAFVAPLPTLSTVDIGSSYCDGETARIDLAGLLDDSYFTVDYTVDGVPYTSNEVHSEIGDANFTTVPLTAANNGKTLRITGITNTGSGCKSTFAKDVTMTVREITTATATVNTPLAACASATISGTSTTDNLTINVYKNGGLRDFATPYGLAWSIYNISLNAGDKIRISVREPGKCEGPLSAEVTAIAATQTATPVVTTPIYNGATSVSGTSEANASVIVYKAGTTQIGTATANGSGAWSASVSTVAINDVITAKATATDKCISNASTSVTVSGLATVTTTAITAGTTTTPYTSGGNVTSIGGSIVTARGICWRSNSANPTTSDAHTTDGTGTGSFSNTFMGGLFANTTYHVRAYATNSDGTAYGSDVSFTTGATGTFIGEFRDAGIVFYINGSTRLIAAPADQGYVQWGCTGIPIGTSDAIGAGQANTTAIVNGCGDIGIAARLCTALGAGWYLPSQEELFALYTQQAVFGNFNTGTSYFSSSEIDANQVRGVYFVGGVRYPFWKTSAFFVRAIRSF